MGFASSPIISWIYLWNRGTLLWISRGSIYVPFLKSYLHFKHLPHGKPLQNYSIDNILPIEKKKKTSQEKKGSFWISRMLIPDRTEVISYLAPDTAIV